jgi:hypothetical protein
MDSALPPEQSHIEPPEPAVDPDTIHRDSKAKMAGEFLREAAVLTFVFIPLDLLINQRPLTALWGIAIVVLPSVFFGVGVLVERKRRA